MSKKDKTKLVTSGRPPEYTHGVVNPPVYRASTCLFKDTAELKERSKNPFARALFYGRKSTPTQWALEDAMSELEGGAGSQLFPSGMAAIIGTMLSLLETGDHVLVTDGAYEPTRDFCDQHLKKMGITTTYYDPMLGANIKDLIQTNTKVILTESPSSLTFEVQDIQAIVAAAEAVSAYVVLDNTWATPLNFKGIDHGVDVVVNAATKYIVGHSDVMMGIATANERTWKTLRRGTNNLGYMTSADDAYLALRGLRTLSARLAQHEASALKVATWLGDHPKVDRVLHPAFAECPGHDIWRRDFNGSTGLFSFTLKDATWEDADKIADSLTLFGIGFSWGGYESLVLPSDPARIRGKKSWSDDAPLLRLHIGLEDVDDLIADLEKALG